MDERLEACVAELDTNRWAALLLDSEYRLVWISEEMKGFLGEHDETKLGYGEHIAEAMLTDTWSGMISERSRSQLFERALPFIMHSVPEETLATIAETPPYAAGVGSITAIAPPFLWTGTFEYERAELGGYEVQYVTHQLRDESGALVGTSVLTYINVRPNLVSLLARGDAAMYERMASLLEPSRHAAAILFADLEASSELARRLPTARYFELMRDLSVQFDALVAAHCGVVGKHAGDGMTGFFIADHSEGIGAESLGALRTARDFRRHVGDALASVWEPADERDQPPGVNIGLHWGASLYIGQLVPGGRLDVTALGDEVNECARIQETACGGCVLASKAFVESLPAGAGGDGVDIDAIRYTPLGALPDASPKAIRDAGAVAVTPL
jgi:class 3 adenylate cyclase